MLEGLRVAGSCGPACGHGRCGRVGGRESSAWLRYLAHFGPGPMRSGRRVLHARCGCACLSAWARTEVALGLCLCSGPQGGRRSALVGGVAPASAHRVGPVTPAACTTAACTPQVRWDGPGPMCQVTQAPTRPPAADAAGPAMSGCGVFKPNPTGFARNPATGFARNPATWELDHSLHITAPLG